MDTILLLLIAVIAIGGPIMYWLSNKVIGPLLDRIDQDHPTTRVVLRLLATVIFCAVLYLAIVYGILDIDGNGSGWFN